MITGVFNSRLDLGQFFGLIRKKISKSKDGSILKSREGAKARRREGAKARSDYYWTPSYQILMVGFKNTLPAPDIDLIFAR